MRQARGVIAASIARLFSGSSKAEPRTGKRIAFEALESRILLSADPLAAGTLVVVDGSLGDLSDQWSASDVLVLDSERDGLEQITEALAARTGEISELHIVSHGWNGALSLGSTTLDAASLDSHQAQLRAWADALTADADILFYGCNLAADEASIGFIKELSNLTGADIAASTDLTGAAGLGGDWDLEYATGSIEANTIAPGGDLVLATINYNADADTLTFTADAGQADLVTITSPAANQLRIVVGNGDTIVLTGDTASGFTLNGTNTQLDISRAAAPVLAFGLSLEDQNDTVSFLNNQAGLGSVSIDGGLGSDTVTLNTTQLSGNLTLGTEAVTVTAGAQVNVGTGGVINASGSGVVFSGGSTVTAATFSAGSISITAPTVNLNANTTVGTLSLSGTGILSGTGNVTLEGPGSTWSAGSLTGAGDLFIGSGATLSITGTAAKTLNKDLVNDGTINWAGGNIQTTGTTVATFTNNGAFNLNAGASGPNVMFGNGSGSMTLNNTGSIVHTLGITNFAGLATVNNQGTVEVAGGTLSFGNIVGTHTGSFSGAGVLQFGAGTHTLTAASSVTTNNVSFSGGTANVEGVYDIAGTTLVSGGTANLRGTLTSLGNALNITSGTANLNGANATVTTFTQGGGLLSGTGDLTVTGAAILSGGTMTGSGSTITQGALSISNSIGLDAGRTLDVRGGASWTAGQINLNANGAPGSGSIVNRAGSTFTTSANSVMVASFVDDVDNGEDALFTNEGTFRKTGGTGATALTTAFHNSGLVDVQVGTLNLSNGGTHSGSFSGAGTLQFGGGTHTLSAASSVTTSNVTFAAGDVTFGTTNVAGEYNIAGTTRVDGGTANFTGTVTSLGSALNMTGGIANFDGSNATVATFTQDGGVLSGTGSLTVTGATSLASGTMTGSGSTITLGALTINGDIGLDAGRTLDVRGGASWTAGQINLNVDGAPGSGSIVNRATSTFTTSADAAMVGTDARFINEGTFLKAGGTGSTVVTNLENTGIVQVQAGVLEAAGSTLVQAGTIDLANGATFSRPGGFTNSGTLSGNGAFNVGGTGTLTNEGVIAPGTSPDSPGLLTIDGHLTLTSDSVIDFDLAGDVTRGTDYDAINVGGTATLDGDANIYHLGGFVPTSEDSFLVITANFVDLISLRINPPHGFEYTAVDDEQSVTFQLVDNEPPVAADDIYGTDEDTQLVIAGPGVLDNDADPDLDMLTATLVTGPVNGTLSFNADGSFTYTPNANFNGGDSFTYTVSDGQGGSDTATVSLNVTAVNDAPDAVNDSVTTNEDTALTVTMPGLLSNDTDVEGDSLTVTDVTQGANGAVVINGDGTLTYTPAANYFGPDSFTYTVSDGQGGSDTATVSVTVNPVNDAPVAAGDSFTTNEDTALTVTIPGILGNDTDIDSTLTAVLETGPAHGTLTLNQDGSFTYTPGLNYFGSDSFTYRASDGSLSHLATVSLTVTAVNDAPDAVNDSVATDEDVAAIIPVRANDTDVEGNSLTVTGVTQGANGTVADNGDGTLTYTPNANFNGSDSFTYSVSDGQGGSDTATVLVTVNPVNDAPTATADAYTTNEDTALTVSMPGVLGNDTDIDSATLTAALVTGPTNGTLTLNTNGGFTYTPNANFNGGDSFTYTVSDGQLVSGTVAVSLTVNTVNDAPVAADDSVTTNEDVAVTIPVRTNDTDVDGDSLTVTGVTQGTHGTVADNGDGTLTYTPNANFNGSDSFTYSVSDGLGGIDTATVSVTVNPVNDAPVAAGDSFTTNEDTALIVTIPGVLGNDTDVDSTTLTAVLETGPTNGTLTINSNGSFTYTPNANFSGTDTFTYRASDGALSHAGLVTISVTAVNDEPVVGDDVATTDEDVAVIVPVRANDTDVEGNPLTVTGITQGANGAVANNGDGTLTYTPNANFNGSDSFTYTVSDGQGGSDTATVSVTVNPVNDAPDAVADSFTTDEDTMLTVSTPGVLGNDTDVDSAMLTATLVTGPVHGTLTFSANGSFTYTPNANFNGGDSFVYAVNDGQGGSDTETVQLTIASVNDAPVALDDAYATSENVALTVAMPGVLANDTDVDTGGLTAALLTGPAHGTLTFNADGSFVYTPNLDYSGDDSFGYTVNDGQGGSDVGMVRLTIGGAQNNAPVAENDSYTTDEDVALTVTVPGVLANDTDADSGTLTAALVAAPANGTLTFDSDGSFTYTPDANFNGEDSFTYTVSDGQGGSDTATVLVTVNPVNDAPDVQEDAYEVLEDGVLEVDAPGVLGNDSDVDGDVLSAEVVDDVAHGTLILGADGSFSYTPHVNFSGIDTFTYSVGDGESTGTSVTIFVLADNDPPEAVDDSATTAEDTSVNIDVLANDEDIEGDTLTVTGFGQGAHGTVSRNLDGTLIYTPAPNFHGTDSFVYTLGSDEFSDTGMVTVTVNPVNDAPVAGDDVATTSQDAAVTVAVLTNDQDMDGGSLIVGGVTLAENGTVVINADGTVTYTPNAGFSGDDSFEYSVSDGRGGSDTGEVTVTVNAASGNDAPDFVEVADKTIQEGHELRFYVGATDEDDPAGSLIYSVTGLPAGATFNAATGQFVWVPADEEGNQITTVTFEVLDPKGATDTMEVVLTATNVAPAVNAGADQVVGMQKVKHDDDHRRFSKGLWHDHHRRGEATVDIAASFNDLGTLDTHTATIDWGDGSRRTAGRVSEDPFGPPGSTAGANGTVTGTHTYKKAGVYTVTVTVTDDDGAIHTDTLTVTVKDPNRLLKGGADSYKVREDNVLHVDAAHGVLANDRAPGGVPLEARLVEGPDHGELTFNADGSFTYRPHRNFHGEDSFWYEFTDGVNVSQAMEVELKVKSDGRRETRIDWGGNGGWHIGHLGGAKYANLVDFLVSLARRFD